MVVGVDIGGTKTHVRIASAAGDDVDLIVASSLWRRGAISGDIDNAQRLVMLFLAQIDNPNSTPLVVGAHGCDSDAQCEAFAERLRAFYPGPVTVVNDAGLLAPAAGIDNAIAVIVGTGSIVVGRTGDGESISAGGYGWILGDPGSAPGIVREAMRAVLKARDEGAPFDRLGTALLEHYGVNDDLDLSYAFMRELNIAAWASLAPLVFSAADAGSVLAEHVIDAAAAELAGGVHSLRMRGAVGDDVVVAGGVVTHQPRLIAALRHHIGLREPGLAVHLVSVPPVAGAIALARRAQPAPTT
ncbi:MAG TPA: BadF/BadG/BcrA/BcrD ATPase family protein [Terrimesophilobacter sp.]|nr:BadF/BadG/BcrA/BcrD ATPase family protein [Terrimesophilobacter sp.]